MIRQERYISIQLISKVLYVVLYGPYSQSHIKNHRRTPCFLLAYKVERYRHQVLLLKLTHYERNRRTCFTKSAIYLSAVQCSTGCKFTLFVPCVIPAHKATSGTGGPSSQYEQLYCVFFSLLCERSEKFDIGHILYYLTIELDHAKRDSRLAAW